jgi:hypothetical protein
MDFAVPENKVICFRKLSMISKIIMTTFNFATESVSANQERNEYKQKKVNDRYCKNYSTGFMECIHDQLCNEATQRFVFADLPAGCGAGAGVDSAWEQGAKRLEARKMLVNRADFHQLRARCVGQLFV